MSDETLSNLLSEDRRFPPPAVLAAEANVTAAACTEASADGPAFWAAQAERPDRAVGGLPPAGAGGRRWPGPYGGRSRPALVSTRSVRGPVRGPVRGSVSVRPAGAGGAVSRSWSGSRSPAPPSPASLRPR